MVQIKKKKSLEETKTVVLMEMLGIDCTKATVP